MVPVGSPRAPAEAKAMRPPVTVRPVKALAGLKRPRVPGPDLRRGPAALDAVTGPSRARKAPAASVAVWAAGAGAVNAPPWEKMVGPVTRRPVRTVEPGWAAKVAVLNRTERLLMAARAPSVAA